MESFENAKVRILRQSSLATVVGEVLQLKKRSGRLVGCCPFHDEKSGSFTLYEDHYYCFGCKEHGDVIDFVRKQQGLSFVDALRYLAKKFNIEAPELDNSRGNFEKNQKSGRLLTAVTLAQDYFSRFLQSATGTRAREYLAGRGFPEATQKELGFGLAPPESGPSLTGYLTKQGYTADELIEASLGSAGRRGVYDYFRGRITIPIKDAQGRLVGFGARALSPEDQPKYLNSREWTYFVKGFTLFGLERARQPIRNKRRAVVVEGYMDALQLWQNGFTETVACLGTALTAAHLKALSHTTSQVILLFDGDAAGRKAGLSAIDTALEVPSLNVKVALLPDGLDPDEFVKKQGVASLEAPLNSAQDLLAYALQSRLQGSAKTSIPDRVQKEIIPWLLRVTDPIKQSFLASRVAEFSAIPLADIQAQLREPRIPANSQRAARQGAALHDPPSATLSARGMEVLGHLFWMSPLEVKGVDQALLLKELLAGFLWPDGHRHILGTFLEMLGRGDIPAEAEDHEILGQTLYSDSDLLRCIQDLRSQKSIYESRSHLHAVRQLINYERTKQVRDAISALKQQMAVQSRDPRQAESVRDLLRAIQDMTKELGDLEKKSREIHELQASKSTLHPTPPSQ